MPRFCASCGTAIADGSAVCSKCGKSTAQSTGGGAAVAPAQSAGVVQAPATGGLQDNMAGALAYVTIIPAILFLVMAPYNQKKFVRFHAFQCLFLAAGLIAVHIVLAFIPILGWIVSLFVSLATLVLWVLLIMKAYQGQMFKLPLIGDFAEQQANNM